MKEHVTISEPRPLVVGVSETSGLPKVTGLPESFNVRQPVRRKKRRPFSSLKFEDIYEPTGETLGQGSHAKVKSYRHKKTKKEYAVKVINKQWCDRKKVLKEVEIFHQCQGHKNILDLVEFMEEMDKYYLVFDKIRGGNLLENIHRRGFLTESDASRIVGELAAALNFLHNKGIAHRDLKPENILCESAATLGPVKLIDFDLGSDIMTLEESPLSTPELMTPVGSAEYMAPEVVDTWVGEASTYDKKCDIWSLGVILYIMLSGSPPFYAKCGEDCGWERGMSCHDCLDMLFERIREGTFDFPEREWGCVSERAKDLIRNLLVRDPHKRYSAKDVLGHPWVREPAPETPLATPNMLGRNKSSQVLEAFSETMKSFQRLLLVTPSGGLPEGQEGTHPVRSGISATKGCRSTSKVDNSATRGDRSATSLASFFIGDSPEEAAAEAAEGMFLCTPTSDSSADIHSSIEVRDSDVGASAPIPIRKHTKSVGPTLKLSPPCSSLAMRRRRSLGRSLSQSQ